MNAIIQKLESIDTKCIYDIARLAFALQNFTSSEIAMGFLFSLLRDVVSTPEGTLRTSVAILSCWAPTNVCTNVSIGICRLLLTLKVSEALFTRYGISFHVSNQIFLSLQIPFHTYALHIHGQLIWHAWRMTTLIDFTNCF